MTILKLLPINNSVITIINTEVSTELNRIDVSEEVKTEFEYMVSVMLQDYLHLDCNIIGKWEYDTETSSYNLNGLSNIVYRKLNKYKPYILVLNDEFVKVEEKEKRDYTNSAHGTTRGAIEDSPITSAPITSAPDDSTEWNLNNPTLKNGSQFDNEYERNEQVLNPEWQLRLLKFNVGELNLTRIAEMFVKSLIEEYNTVY